MWDPCKINNRKHRDYCNNTKAYWNSLTLFVTLPNLILPCTKREQDRSTGSDKITPSLSGDVNDVIYIIYKYRLHVNCALFTVRVLWLLQKYTDVVFVDEDEDPPESRTIVDLEWSIDDIIIRDDQGSAC